MKRGIAIVPLVAFSIMVFCANVHASVFYVAPYGNDVTGNGGYHSPFKTIQRGIDETASGDTVFVKDGIYRGLKNININFFSIPGDSSSEEKSLTLQSVNGPLKCIIDCENEPGSSGIVFNQSENHHLSRVEGFTIRNATNSGIRVDDASPNIVGNIFTSCSSEKGGGIYYLTQWSGGQVISNNIFKGNSAKAGAAIWILAGSPVIESNTVIRNSSPSGAGIYMDWSWGNPVFINNNISDNSGDGLILGECYSSNCTNNTIVNNSGEGIVVLGAHNPLNLKNTILWHNGAAELSINIPSAVVDVSYCDMKGGQAAVSTGGGTLNWLAGNIDLEPFFTDPDNGDYHLMNASPCIGAGTSVGAPPLDIVSALRGSPPDMGAFESPLDDPETLEFHVAEAAALGLVNFYCYLWDGYEYQPIGANEYVYLPPWTAFWVMVRKEVDILFPKWVYAPPPPATMTITLDPDRYYLLSPPLYPQPDRDYNANLGDDLGDNLYENTWRVSKWNAMIEDYEYYSGPGSLPEMLPGRGFFIQHIHPNPVTIDLSGSGDFVPVLNHYYEMKLPSNGDPYTFHMIGNPFWYDRKWKDCLIRIPATMSLPAGKTAALSDDDIELWYISLKLISADGKLRDTFNRAGVVLTPDIDPGQLCAVDIPPVGDYIRLSLRNDSGNLSDAFSYVFCEDGLGEYNWNLDISASLKSVDTVLSLDNIESIPDDHEIFITNNQTGERFTIDGNRSFSMTLCEGQPLSYMLSVRKETSPVRVDQPNPLSFDITEINPNPFNPITTLKYTIDRPGTIDLSIYNLSGHKVATLVDGYSEAGQFSIGWDAVEFASGVYIVSLESGARQVSKKMTLLK